MIMNKTVRNQDSSLKQWLTRKTPSKSWQQCKMIERTLKVSFRWFPNLIKLNYTFTRNKSLSSDEWVNRRLKDPYVEKALKDNYRCRSAYKLLEIDEKFGIIKPGQVVLDLGAAPGSWCQVLVKKTNALEEDQGKPVGFVLSVDLRSFQGVKGATVLNNKNILQKSTQDKIIDTLNGRKLDLLVSDMSPSATGIRSLDQENSCRLGICALKIAINNLRVGGTCLIKMWAGQHDKIVKTSEKFFCSTKFIKPKSSQKESSEFFILSLGFKGNPSTETMQ